MSSPFQSAVSGPNFGMAANKYITVSGATRSSRSSTSASALQLMSLAVVSISSASTWPSTTIFRVMLTPTSTVSVVPDVSVRRVSPSPS